MGKFTAFDLGILQIRINQLHSSETDQFQEEWHNYKQQKNNEIGSAYGVSKNCDTSNT